MLKLDRTKSLILAIAIVGMFCGSGKAELLPQGAEHMPPGTEGQQPRYAADEIIIKLKAEAQEKICLVTDADNRVTTGLVSLDRLNKKYGISQIEQVVKPGTKPSRKLSAKAEQKRQELLRIYKFKLGLKKGINIEEAVGEYQRDPHVEYAEPNYIYHTNPLSPGKAVPGRR